MAHSVRLILALLLLATLGCSKCSQQRVSSTDPVSETKKKKKKNPTHNPSRIDKVRVSKLQLKRPDLLKQQLKDQLREKMAEQGITRDKPPSVPATQLCAEKLPGEPSTKLVESGDAVPAARSLRPLPNRRIPDRILVTWDKDTTIGQANAFLAEKKLRVGAFAGRSPFVMVCTDSLGVALDSVAKALSESPLVASAKPALGAATP